MHSLQERELVLLLASVVGLVFGFFPLWRRVFFVRKIASLFDALFLYLEAKLNRIHRSEAVRRGRGTFVICLCLMIAMGMGWFFTTLSEHSRLFQCVEVLVLANILRVLDAGKVAGSVRDILQKNTSNIDILTFKIPHITSHNVMDKYAVLRFVIEFLALEIFYKVVLFALSYLCGGLYALIFVALLVRLQEVYVAKELEGDAFLGRVTQLMVLICWMPKLLTCVYVMLAAIFSPGAHVVGSMKVWMKSVFSPAFLHKNLLSVWAGGLHITLGGAYNDGGRLVERVWVGDGSVMLEVSDLSRALWLYRVIVGVILLNLCVLYWV